MARPADSVYASLKDEIERGVLSPGRHLVEEEIGARFEVSRTPIRNAMKRLQADGLVTIEANRGAFVASWTNEDAAEVMTIRALLEPLGAALAAQRRTPEQVDALFRACEEMELVERERPSGFRDILAKQNNEFHLQVLQVARSPRLFSMCRVLARAPLMAGSFHFYDDDQLRRSLGDHRDIVQLIAVGDVDSARVVMGAHLRLAFRFMADRTDAGTSDGAGRRPRRT